MAEQFQPGERVVMTTVNRGVRTVRVNKVETWHGHVIGRSVIDGLWLIQPEKGRATVTVPEREIRRDRPTKQL